MKLRLAMGQPQYDEGKKAPKFIEVDITEKFIHELKVYYNADVTTRAYLKQYEVSPLSELVWKPGTETTFLYEYASWMDEEEGHELVEWENTCEQCDNMELKEPFLTLRSNGELVFQAEQPEESTLLYSHAFTLDDICIWMAAEEKLVYYPFKKEDVC